MKDWKRNAVRLLVVLLAAAFAPRPAAAVDATLYEALENMSTVSRDGHDYRQAYAALLGTARPGTLLCPFPATCRLHAFGMSSVDVATGLGTFGGSLSVVVQGDNPVDGPEVVVVTGRFSGKMDFAPALVAKPPLPYGTVVGTVSVDNGGSSPFSAIFYLPFAFPGDPASTPYYLSFTGLQPAGVVPVLDSERALGEPMVKFEICLGPGGC